jgi:hypothetical protein
MVLVRSDGVELELKLVNLLVDGADEFRDIGYCCGSLGGDGRKAPDENDGTTRQLVFQDDVFPGEVVPIEFGFLHKENFVFVPAGDFHTTGIVLKQRANQPHGASASTTSSFRAMAVFAMPACSRI